MRLARLVLLAGLLVVPSAGADPTVRLELHLVHGARSSPHTLLLTLGGPVYCAQLRTLAARIDASLACTDYGPNRYEGVGGRAGRREDWGDPTYLSEVARLPARLRSHGVKISKLVIVGVTYSGFANAELVAVHPELRPAALVVVDGYLDLPARYEALPPSHETRREIELALGGALAQRRAAYEARSPSHHLDGLAEAIRGGMRFVDVWSVSAHERHEFRGATCSRVANAQWLADLAGVLRAPVTGYVTDMPHAHELWDRGMGLLQIAGVVAHTTRPLLAHRITFRPRRRLRRRATAAAARHRVRPKRQRGCPPRPPLRPRRSSRWVRPDGASGT